MESGQEQRLTRRFGLGDGLILMAALALPLRLLRAGGGLRIPLRVAVWWETSQELLRLRLWNLPNSTRSQAACMVAAQIIDELIVKLLCSVLFGLALAQPLLRSLRPRPPLREVIRQPGFVACVGVIVGTLILIDLLWIAQVDVGYWVFLGSAMVLVWPLLGVFPWRPEASWIDRLGRAVGWGWIIGTAGAIAAYYLNSWS